uniref:Uncharacterized protein n=1 Tax=Parascaris equorum TaxID=6256 RepID=A0A914RQV4_PAREQ
MELLGDYGSNEWPSTLAPLNVSTATAASGAPSLGAGPLSNPTTSNAHFWKQSLKVQLEGAGLNHANTRGVGQAPF